METSDYRKFCIDGNKKRIEAINNWYVSIILKSNKTEEKPLKSNGFSFII